MNTVILIGNLGKDPESHTTDKGAIVKFSLATTSYYGGENHTDWHNVVCFGKTAEMAEKFLSKGKKIALEGTIRYRTWDDKDGNRKYMTEIIANRIEFLTPRDEQGTTQGTTYTAPDSNDDDGQGDLPF